MKMQKNKNKPLVSVLMTMYNAQSFLREAVESILLQTYDNIELVIVDDGSTDGSKEIIEEFAKKNSSFSSPRLRRGKRVRAIFLKKNVGPSKASNIGLKQCRGTYVARMDADDICYKTRIAKQVRFLQKNPQVVLLGGQCKLIDKKGKVVGEKRFPSEHRHIYKSLFRINPIQHPSCMINTKLVGKSKISYKNHFVLSHDLELVFDLSRYGKLANLKDTILYYRQTPNSLSLKDPKETFRSTLKIRKKAVKVYGYKPGILDLLVNEVQKIVIMFLPDKFVYPLFMLFRGKGRKVNFGGFGKVLNKRFDFRMVDFKKIRFQFGR